MRTSIKTSVPMSKSGSFEFVKYTSIPEKITPVLMRMSLEVKIILARICACSFPLDRCNNSKQLTFASKAIMEITIIVLNSGILDKKRTSSALPQTPIQQSLLENTLPTSLLPFVVALISRQPTSLTRKRNYPPTCQNYPLLSPLN